MCAEIARQEATNLRHHINYASQDLPIGLMSDEAARAASRQENVWARLIEAQMDAPTVAYLETLNDPVVALQEVKKLKAAKQETEKLVGFILNGIKTHLAGQGLPEGITGIYNSSPKSLELFRQQAAKASSAAKWELAIAMSRVDTGPPADGTHSRVSALLAMAMEQVQNVSKCSNDAGVAAAEAAHARTLTDVHAKAMEARKLQLAASHQKIQVFDSMSARATWERVTGEAHAALHEIAKSVNAIAAQKKGPDSAYCSMAIAIDGEANAIGKKFHESTDLVTATEYVLQLRGLANQAWKMQNTLMDFTSSRVQEDPTPSE